MKGVEAVENLYVIAKLRDRDGAMCDETFVTCVTAKLRDAMVWGNELRDAIKRL